MTLLRAFDVNLAFGSRTLFSNLEFVIESGERVGLVGVNGCGKSTLMKILAGSMKADTGTLQLQRGARVTYLPQEPSFPEGATVESELAVAQAPLRAALDEHTALSKKMETEETTEKDLERMGELAEIVERLGGWDTAHEARTLLDRLGVKDWDRKVSELSGGQRKRVAIARALLTHPDLLMLDEPTNHLDAETTEWLEEELDNRDSALLLVTHDRYFLDGLVDRIVEVEPPRSPQQPGGLTSYPGNYESYLEQKVSKIAEGETQQHKRERWMSQEVAWLRRGPQARRTKSKARIERARKLLSEKGFVRPKIAALQISAAPRLSQKVIEAKHVDKSFGAQVVLKDVNLIVQPGERIALLGRNGAGKTTLVRTLLGELKPDAGEVVLGARTKIAYYDQGRDTLDENDTVAEAAWHDEWVTLGDQKIRLSDYLDDLLFPIPMQKQKVAALSGGERNRLLLAKLFLQGANVLVLDEPTNDLDLVTLNVLERLIQDFKGAVIIVTHDRYFLDKVATTLLVFEGGGKVVRHEGNYDTFKRLRAQRPEEAAPMKLVEARKPVVDKTVPVAPPPQPVAAAPAKKASKLSYKDQRELDGMEATIEAADQKKASLSAELAKPEVFTNSGESSRLLKEYELQSAEVDRLYARWEELQKLAGT